VNKQKLKAAILIFISLTVTACAQPKNEININELIAKTTDKMKKQNYPEALADCNKALMAKPNSAIILAIRSSIKIATNDTIGALSDASNAIAIDSNCAPAYEVRYAIRMSNDKQGALADISKLIGLTPEHAMNYFYRGTLELSVGKDFEASQDFNKAINMLNLEIEKNPNSPIAYYSRGMANGVAKNYEQACDDFKKAESLGVSQAKEFIGWYCK
jgi:tetratricopeptide (TPR) repeat protein